MNLFRVSRWAASGAALASVLLGATMCSAQTAGGGTPGGGPLPSGRRLLDFSDLQNHKLSGPAYGWDLLEHGELLSGENFRVEASYAQERTVDADGYLNGIGGIGSDANIWVGFYGGALKMEVNTLPRLKRAVHAGFRGYYQYRMQANTYNTDHELESHIEPGTINHYEL